MASLSSLKGIGQIFLKELNEAGITSIKDLLRYFPRDYEFRDKIVPLAEALKFGGGAVKINTVCTVISHQYFGSGWKKTLKIIIQDNSASASLICFGRNFLGNTLQTGKKFFLSGSFQIRYGELQCSSFDYEPYSENPKSFGKIVPIYPSTGKLTSKFFRKIMLQAIETEGRYAEDLIPEKLIRMNCLLPKNKALENIHFPESREMLAASIKTLKYEELFLFQKNIKLSMEKRKIKKERPFAMPRKLQREIAQRLPFSLTEDQISVINMIYADSLKKENISRIIQGDVGCGKTLVGFLSAVPYIEAGYQTVFAAPTELLAKQHMKTASELFKGTGIRLAFLSGRLTGKKKELLLEELSDGKIDMLIGTHAVFSDAVNFKNLGFAVIDEQQRFGVLQRSALIEKGDGTDYIMMTATPIPRSLETAFLGGMEISTIKTVPPGRRPIITYTVMEENENKVYERIRKELEKGFQVYFVCPLIENSEKLDLKNACKTSEILSRDIFPDYPCGLIHSKMGEEEKEEIMSDFAAGKIKILIATSIVEVGVDVKKATSMVIEHAERFGLSSLHQLRGRVGRSDIQSYAFLIFGKELSDNAKERLRIMKQTNDGFIIAEKDLQIRGPGDIAGIEQSGFMNFRLADIINDTDLIKQIRQDIEYAGI